MRNSTSGHERIPTLRWLPFISLLFPFLILVAAHSFPTSHPSISTGSSKKDAEGRYMNLAGAYEKAGPSVTLPFFVRRVLGYFRGLEGVPKQEDAAAEKMSALYHAPGALVTWVGHATLLVQQDGVRYLTDPNWSDWAGPGGRIGAVRYLPAGVPIERLPALDFVVISHNHYDHLDLPSLTQIAESQPAVVFLVPLGNGDLLRDAGIENVEELDWGQVRQFGKVVVHCLPNQHWSARGLGDERKALWGSWAVTGPERRVYFAGDTGFFPEFRAIGEAFGPFDLAILPIGAYEPVEMMKFTHMNPEEAIEAATLLAARRTLGMHYGTFNLTDEPIGEPPKRFVAAAREAGWSEERAWVFRIGETRPF